MVKAIIFMNEHIREPHPTAPMVRVQFADGAFEDVHGVDLPAGSIVQTDPRGCKEIKTHTVKAWVEVCCETSLIRMNQGRERVCILR